MSWHVVCHSLVLAAQAFDAEFLGVHKYAAGCAECGDANVEFAVETNCLGH